MLRSLFFSVPNLSYYIVFCLLGSSSLEAQMPPDIEKEIVELQKTIDRGDSLSQNYLEITSYKISYDREGDKALEAAETYAEKFPGTYEALCFKAVAGIVKLEYLRVEVFYEATAEEQLELRSEAEDLIENTAILISKLRPSKLKDFLIYWCRVAFEFAAIKKGCCCQDPRVLKEKYGIATLDKREVPVYQGDSRWLLRYDHNYRNRVYDSKGLFDLLINQN